jgi:HAD superfamily hydrolase (TIGR01509 family)
MVAAMTELGHALSHPDAQAIVYGRGWNEIYRDIVARYPAIGLSSEELENRLRELFTQEQRARDIRIEGSIELLRSLARQYRVAVVSGSPREDVRLGVTLAGVAEYLEFFLGAGDYPAGKPDPSPYLTAASRLGVPPRACLVFEDSAAGVVSAKRAGMWCVALRRPATAAQELDQADLVLTDLAGFTPAMVPGLRENRPQ